MSFHKSNLGSFGESLPHDLNGYVHLTQMGWMNAPLDCMTWQGYSYKEKLVQCREMAIAARTSYRDAVTALAEWRK